jgi:hypothetical protein
MARIAIDIDSTLHHYWPLLERVARERFGVELPYESQRGWGIEALETHEVVACVEETHSDENILGAEPYPGAVEAVEAWHRDGHFIQVTSHRRERTRAATAAWLERIGLPHHDLHLSFDKVSRCVEMDIDVLVDDSPANITRAREHGIVPATLAHPWTEHLAAEGVIVAEDWPELQRRLEPVLNGAGRG